MSKQTESFKMEKCIHSRLWYTSLILYETSKNDKDITQKNKETVDFNESEILIKSLIRFQEEDQCQWITQVLLNKLVSNIAFNAKPMQKQHKRMQMVHALQLCEDVPECVQQELIQLYDTNLNQILEKIQKDVIIFLEKNLDKNPAIVCWIMNELLFTCFNTLNVANVLKDKYIPMVKKLLESAWLQQRLLKENENYSGSVLCILSKVNMAESERNEFATWLFPELLKRFDIKDVELALYSRENRKLFNEWCCYLDEINGCSKVANTLDSALKISQVIFQFGSDSKMYINKNELLKRVIKTKSHWFIDILDICYILLINGKFNEVSSILSCDLLKSIWPVLLFKVLNDCPQEQLVIGEKNLSICDCIKFLIKKCNFDKSRDSALRELNTVLNKHIKIVERILNWNKESSTTNYKTEIETEDVLMTGTTEHRIVSAKQIFFLLQHFNTLSVLKTIMNVHEQDYCKIRGLLKDLGESENIFQAYSSILNALKAILLCDSYNAKRELISSHFSDMKRYLQTLHPLKFRLKVMENIFSLLFLRHEDFNFAQYNSDDDNTSTADEKSRTENKPLQQCSTGFICNKYAIRDTLLHLEDTIFVTKIEFANWKKYVGITEETDEIQKSISSITAAVVNARWRLELYTNPQFIENSNSMEDVHTTSVSSKSEVTTGKSSNRMKESPFFFHGDSTLDETKIRSDSGSESGHINSAKWRRRSRNSSTIIDTLITRDTIHKPLLVNFMLASKESLVIQCLWKSDYVKAQEIIEMSDMKNTNLNGEVQFSKAVCTFKQNMLKYEHKSQKQNSYAENEKSSTLENIRLAAEEGLQSSRQTGQLETFLASQEANVRMLNTDILTGNEMLTLCVIDLALTMGQVSPISKNLCDVAIKYLKLCKTFDNTEYAHFFFKIYQQLYENKDELPLSSILCDAKIPLSSREWKEKSDFWADLITKHQEFKESQMNIDIINDTLIESKNLSGLNIFGKMIAIFEDSENYLQSVYSYLQLLNTIIPTDKEILSVSNLLEAPLHYYFGHQILELDVQPNKLEIVAQKLQVNLIYSILTNACPKLPCEKDIKPNITSNDGGCTVLNKPLNKSELNHVVQGPNQCASEILTELLQVLNNLNQFNINYGTCKAIAEHSDIQAALNKTSRLASLDLSELSVGNETLTFFLNTWNIMFLHASLTIWANCPPSNNLQHNVSLMSIGYMIGDLGLVTLSMLRSKLLDNVMSDYEFFPQVEELNEPAWQDLDITHDPRVIFVMANEFFGTPRVRVLDARSLNEDLTNAVHEYLRHYSLQSKEESTEKVNAQKTVLLPDLVRRFECFLSQSDKNGTVNVNDRKNLMFSVENYFKLTNENFTIQYMTPFYSYDIILKYSSVSTAQHQEKIGLQKATWKTRTIRSSLLQYLEGHCWILSYLLQRMHNENPTILKNNCDNLKRTVCLDRLLSSTWIAQVKPLFDNNQTLAAMHETIPMRSLWSYFECALKEDKWHDCLELINVLPDNVMMTNSELQCFKDKILSHMVSQKEVTSSAKVLQYLYQIKDVHILAQTVLNNIRKWHVHFSEHALLHALHHTNSYKLPAHCKLRMNETLRRVLIFHKMLPYCVNKSNGTWYDIAYCTETIDSFKIIESLIRADKFELCLEWLDSQAFSFEIQPSITQDFLIGLLKNETQNFKQVSKLLQALPLNQSVKMCKDVLKKLESIDALQFVAHYLLQHCKATETIKYRGTLVGIDILRMMEVKDRPLYIHLIKEPLLMLEQLLMNCKFESIQKILNEIGEKLEQVNISISSFDEIIRFYAERSLDCRVALQREGIENKSKNMQNSASDAESTEFVMPLIVPTKEGWVPNDKARKCSCCKTVIFSMFNRRHHCRRCGRVICAVCSQHRMQVHGYPSSVPVRVCNDCKRQTVLQMRAAQGTPSSQSSETFDYWRLTRDQTHNQTIREEFSFEYSPNISLCLAILNLHSDHEAYTRFLFDRCDEMKHLLEPVSGGKVNLEVDHIVIIKMIRSLLVAAKVKCAKLGLNTGLTHCDRFLSQVDLIATLVQSDCLDLIPSGDYLGDHSLRKLRDLLIEKEQWILALDVSTKAGLDMHGVWATWGKACLKMGFFDQAREKFFHCLDKILHEDYDDWVVYSYPKESPDKKSTLRMGKTEYLQFELVTKEAINVDEPSLRKIEFSKNRPLKDPALLKEILQILDNLSIHGQHTQYSQQYKSSAALDILNTFSGFKLMNQAQFSVKQSASVSQNIYYHESLYYLLTYGSCTSILEFFLKHDEFDKCLVFALETDLERDLFFNAVYMFCLKNGSIEKLHETMKNKDSTLLTWRKYLINVCHNLERRQYLNILYQLQLFMKDSVRAAMTCIRFYVNEATDYTNLCSRGNLLLDAQKHLESELQIETLSRRRRNSTGFIHSGQGILTMEMEPMEIDRHINTICRQLEIAKFLGNSEKEDRAPARFLSLFPDMEYDGSHGPNLPTLFGNQQEKIHLAVLAILCGRDIEEGFGIAFRIMQDYNLPQQKVYSLTGHVLAIKNNIPAIEQLIKCCHTSGTPNSFVISDYVLTHCIKLLINRSYSDQAPIFKNQIDSLVRLITDVELKINAYIECKQLKAAYLLAVKYSRAQDIRKILKESDRLGQNAIKAICVKWLQQEPKS